MSNPCEQCYLFVGPSAYGIDWSIIEESKSLFIMPPIARGDVDSLIKNRRPATIAIVDGLFQQRLAVGHMEIRNAIDLGWSVWGLSSMGAIRAYEMRDYGMKGYGYVYNQFVHHEDFRDDEVALLHAPMKPYFPISEPLVHIRIALQSLCDSKIISTIDGDLIIKKLENLWFGKRTLNYLRSLLQEVAPHNKHIDINGWIDKFHNYRAKTHDLERFLGEEAWIVAK